MNGFIAQRALGWLEGLGRIGLFAVEAAQSLFSRRVDWPGLSYQLYFIGVKSQSVVLVTGAFTAMVGIDHAYAWHNMLKYTQPQHVLMGVIKAVIFGGVIALIGCYKGMNCREGAEGVGRATTEAVVYACITILISNFFLTLFLT